MTKKKKVVVIGGGTGSFTVLSGLKKYPDLELTAIVSMADDGGSTGKLRDEYGVLPPGDIRQCLVALSNSDDLMRELFNFRFSGGSLTGHNFGNIFISAVEKMTGSFNDALKVISLILNVKGQVLPVTLAKVHLVAELNNGKIISGQNEIANNHLVSRFGVKKIYFDKKAKANPEALRSIKEADLIVVGPGNFYSSLIPNFLVQDISGTLIKSRAKKVYVCNLMNQYGQTDNFSVSDFVRGIELFIKPSIFDCIIYNKTFPSRELLAKYVDEGQPVLFGQVQATDKHKYIGTDLLNNKIPKKVKGDTIQRTLIRHDQDKLAKEIVALS
ncbi:MAG: YvcK family protein [Candidatus Vogelbacteria bacterium]|nr:YvcK family protein [Candidatus Vogelbacteria bacterium]